MLLRYYHTLKHLKLVQIAGRIRHRLYRPWLDLRAAPQRRLVRGHWHVQRWREPAMLGPDRFRFLNDEQRVSFQRLGMRKIWKSSGSITCIILMTLMQEKPKVGDYGMRP